MKTVLNPGTPEKIIHDFFTPYKQKKIIHDGNNWKTLNKTFTDTDVREHIQGKITVGYFSTYMTNILAYDIDVHGDLFEGFPEVKLQSLYFKLVALMGYNPSLVIRTHSGGGLHVYYKINRKVFYKLFADELKKIISSGKKLSGIEILPTPKQGIRFPFNAQYGGRVLDVNLQPLECINENDLLKLINAAPVYNSELILQTAFKGVFKHTTRTGQEHEYKKEKRFLKYNEKYLPLLYNGNTNEAIKRIAGNGFYNDLTVDYTAKYITEKMKELNILIKNDTTPEKIKNRVESIYRTNEKNRYSILHDNFKRKQWGTDNLLIKGLAHEATEKIKKVFTLHGHRLKAIEKFCYRLYEWDTYIRELPQEHRLQINCVYKLFYHYTCKGLTPLPRSLLSKWNDRYNNIMPLLARIGIIKLERRAFNPYQEKMYNPDIKGICNYYRVIKP